MEQKQKSGIIDDLNSRQNTLVLVIKDEYKANWQHPSKVTDYVKENYKYIDEIETFDVYVK